MPQKTVLGLLTAAERQLFTFCFKPQFSVVCLGLLERKNNFNVSDVSSFFKTGCPCKVQESLQMQWRYRKLLQENVLKRTDPF